MKPVTIRAQELLDSTMKLSLRPQRNDRQKIIAFILRAAADRLCTDWGELQHPASVLNAIAMEVEEIEEVKPTQTYDEWMED